jgi:hypothetical protein
MISGGGFRISSSVRYWITGWFEWRSERLREGWRPARRAERGDQRDQASE